MSRVNQDGHIAIIAYTVWSRKSEVRQKIIQNLRDWIIENKFKRLVTLSPLTPINTFSCKE